MSRQIYSLLRLTASLSRHNIGQGRYDLGKKHGLSTYNRKENRFPGIGKGGGMTAFGQNTRGGRLLPRDGQAGPFARRTGGTCHELTLAIPAECRTILPS
jgi:hypothetical protein